LRRVVQAFLASKERWKAIFLFLVLLLMMIGLNALNVLSSFIGRDFVSAIEQRQVSHFVSLGWRYFGVFAALTFVGAWYRFAEERLALLWREWQTRRLLGDYLESRTYLHLGRSDLVENPDQNIAEDVRTFTTSTLSFVLLLLNGSFTVLAFSGVLWTISPRLFAISVGYAACGTLLTVFMGRPLIRLNYQQLDKEANFRSELLHVRENADSIAVLGREGRVADHLAGKLDLLVKNMRRMISVNRNLAFFTTGYGYMIQVIPFLVVAPLFIDGQAEFGVVTQSAMAFAHLMGAFSLIVTQFQSISTYTAVVSRLGRLIDGMEIAESHDASLVENSTDKSPGFSRLTIRSGDGDPPILLDLDFRLAPGEWLLIDGSSETAKRNLFRAMAGVWGEGSGSVILPDQDVAFVPERPYLHAGSLRDTLVHSRQDHVVDDQQVTAVLGELGLQALAERPAGLHESLNWEKQLPLATQQLLVIARVMLSGARVVVVDHLLSSLTNDDLGMVFAKLRARGVTCFCFGSGEEDPGQFDRVLRIHPDGTWDLTPDVATPPPQPSTIATV
jgi:vitamin B12/bleomycin/antimicrobial peptide transport system ATP-binding/permease protein